MKGKGYGQEDFGGYRFQLAYAAYALALCVSGLLVLPVVDRWQDLSALARAIERDSAGGELAVLNPDETTLAMLDHRSRMPFTTLAAAPHETAGVFADWLRAHGTQARVISARL